jgi:hypothetical protein
MKVSFAEVTRGDSQGFCEVSQAAGAAVDRMELLGWQSRQSITASLFASPTDFFADAAVLMMVRVARALIAAPPTSFDAGLKSNPRELRDELRLPAEEAAGRDADVTAVVTQRDA